MHNISVLYHIVLTLDTHLSGLTDGCFRTVLDIVVVLDDFRTDESFLEISMDDTSTMRSLPAYMIGPCLYHHLTSGDEGLQIQQRIGFLNQAVYTTLFQTQLVQEHLFVFV